MRVLQPRAKPNSRLQTARRLQRRSLGAKREPRLRSPAAETLQERLQNASCCKGRGFAVRVTQPPRASSTPEGAVARRVQGEDAMRERWSLAPPRCSGSPLNVGCKRAEMNLATCKMNFTTCGGRGFMLLGVGLRFQKLAWAGFDCEAPNLRCSAGAWFSNVVKHPFFLKRGLFRQP